MPKKARELSALAVAALRPLRTSNGRVKTRFMVGGADGLHLRVTERSRSWILRVVINGSRRDLGLGSYPTVTLAAARKVANENRALIASGIDPLAVKRDALAAIERHKESAKTFVDCAEEYIEAHKAEWKNKKHIAQWSSSLVTYAYPFLGKKNVADINTSDVLKVLEAIWISKTETASRLRGRIEKILGWAAFRGVRSGDNPARWRDHLEHHLPHRSSVRQVKHHASLPYHELPDFLNALRKREGVSARALEFSILCASRSGEVRQAVWAEIDLERKLWTIPANRMKARREHVVPLSDAALALLAAQKAVGHNRENLAETYVFCSPRGEAFSDAVFKSLFERMGLPDLTQHGFRSTFREWAGEATQHSREVVEHALAHQLADKAEAAYQRGSLLPKRVALMAEWGKFCTLNKKVKTLDLHQGGKNG